MRYVIGIDIGTSGTKTVIDVLRIKLIYDNMKCKENSIPEIKEIN